MSLVKNKGQYDRNIHYSTIHLDCFEKWFINYDKIIPAKKCCY